MGSIVREFLTRTFKKCCRLIPATLKGGTHCGSFCSQFGPFFFISGTHRSVFLLSNHPLVVCRISHSGIFLIRATLPSSSRSSVSIRRETQSSRATIRENVPSEKVSGIEKCLKRSLSVWANRFTFDDLIGSLLTLGTYEFMELEFMQFYIHSSVTVKRFYTVDPRCILCSRRFLQTYAPVICVHFRRTLLPSMYKYILFIRSVFGFC